MERDGRETAVHIKMKKDLEGWVCNEEGARARDMSPRRVSHSPVPVCVGRLVDFPGGDQQRRNRAWKPPELFSSYKLAFSAASVSGGHVFIAGEGGRGEGMV